MRRYAFASLLLIAAVATADRLTAHPHVWIEMRTDAVFDDAGRMTAINLHWEFDEYYSTTAVDGMDANGNGSYEPEELAPLARENVEALKEYRYFTQLKANGEDVAYGEVSEYGSMVKDGTLSLYFTVPLAEPADPRKAELVYSVYDPTFYIAIELAPKNATQVIGTAPEGCSLEVRSSEADADDAQTPESFYEKLSAADDIGALYAQKIAVACAKKTASSTQ